MHKSSVTFEFKIIANVSYLQDPLLSLYTPCVRPVPYLSTQTEGQNCTFYPISRLSGCFGIAVYHQIHFKYFDVYYINLIIGPTYSGICNLGGRRPWNKHKTPDIFTLQSNSHFSISIRKQQVPSLSQRRAVHSKSRTSVTFYTRRIS